MARAGSTPNVQQAAFHGFGQATGVFAGFGGWQAKGGPEYVDCGVGLWVKQDENNFYSGLASMPLCLPPGRHWYDCSTEKCRICFGLVARHERLGKGAKSG